MKESSNHLPKKFSLYSVLLFVLGQVNIRVSLTSYKCQVFHTRLAYGSVIWYRRCNCVQDFNSCAIGCLWPIVSAISMSPCFGSFRVCEKWFPRRRKCFFFHFLYVGINHWLCHLQPHASRKWPSSGTPRTTRITLPHRQPLTHLSRVTGEIQRDLERVKRKLPAEWTHAAAINLCLLPIQICIAYELTPFTENDFYLHKSQSSALSFANIRPGYSKEAIVITSNFGWRCGRAVILCHYEWN